MYYLFANGLQPLPTPPSDWRGVLAVLTPQELHDAALPARHAGSHRARRPT